MVFPTLNPGQAEESQLEPTQRQGEPYEGIFFEETPVDRTLIAPVPNNDVAAPGVQAPTAPVDANQAAGTPRPTVPVSLVMADPAVEIEVPPTVADSGADDGSLIPLDYCLYNQPSQLNLGRVASHAFPSKRNYYVTSEAEYQAFLEEIVRKPNSKVFIRMCMDKPGAKAKSQEVIRHQEDSLAIAVGSQEEVVNLERLQAWPDQNPHSDTRGDPIAPWVIKLRVHLENRANTRPSETIFIQDPEHLGLALRSDPRATLGLGSCTSTKDGPFGLPSASTATPPAIFANQAAQPPTTPSASVPVPAVVTPLVSAGPVPASARAAPATPLNPDIHPALVADDQSWIMNSIPLTIPGSADSSEIDFLTPDNSHVVVRWSSGASESSVEYLDDSISQPLDSHLGEPGPSRKIARSPHGPAGFKGKGKCTQFKRSVRESPSPSPTHKRAPLPLAPLTKAGRRMTIMEFLIHCNIEEYDSLSHSLINGHCIKHWSFFRGQSAQDLMRIGFPRGLATQIYNGVLELELTMTYDPSDNPPAAGPSHQK
ncbi:hypothetical protein Pst134EA_005370 [Puccinia striiformis f. sp. tritici]|uniref:hypothetical protein n=1 Tax=Puccinia striiformis f. sp. tritici TaxID=168172 RepID=UPI002008BEC2|nr:hypothetical protein Pst134EA_005370 [Puccinia striiformis f. sp. tritici]KAH9471474.1 hypothetical protein Pst134EA_005370 [Puccinia striiformis f. sp. tritici]